MPKRPLNVPVAAAWAGGADGGAWIDCVPRADDSYWCTVFEDENGQIWAQGEFSRDDDSAAREPRLQYTSFDGHRIFLSGGATLVPNGWITFPFPEGGGKRQQFDMGTPISEEEEFPPK